MIKPMSAAVLLPHPWSCPSTGGFCHNNVFNRRAATPAEISAGRTCAECLRCNAVILDAGGPIRDRRCTLTDRSTTPRLTCDAFDPPRTWTEESK